MLLKIGRSKTVASPSHRTIVLTDTSSTLSS